MSKNKRNQNKQYQVFIQKNGGYLEISYEEFCRTQDTIFKDSFFISSNGVLMEVSQEFYKEYYRDKRRERYLHELEVENVISFHCLDSEDFCGEDILIDHNEDVIEQVTTKLMIEKLRSVLPLLTEDEKLLINQIFFEEKSERTLALEYGVSQVAIHKKKERILKKLKNLLEN